MASFNFRQLDLNLLRVLVAIHQGGSVTEAARQLSLSQPAASHALARLRRLLGDELFVRSPRGLQPTRTAQRLAPVVAAHLRKLETLLSVPEAFDPSRSTEQWKLSLSDLGEVLFLPPLARALRREAPNSRLVNNAVALADVGAALESRAVDLAVGILKPRQRELCSEALFREHYVAITAAQWRPPLGRSAAALTSSQLAATALAVAAPTATFHGSVEAMLKQRRLQHSVVVRARHYGALPEIVAATDLMAIVPLVYAQVAAKRFGVKLWELPGEAPVYEVRMVWHRSTAEDPRQSWLRDRVRQLLGR